MADENQKTEKGALGTILKSFGISRDEFSEILSEQKKFSPEAIFQALIEKTSDKFDLEGDAKEVISEVFHSAIEIDPKTGAYGKSMTNLVRETAGAYGADGKESAVVRADFSNIGGANDAIGRDNVDRSINIMLKIYEDEILKANPDGNPPPHVSTVRVGGDEIEFVVSNVSEEKLSKALENVQKRIELFSKEMGVNQVNHPKYEDEVAALSLKRPQTKEEEQSGIDAERLNPRDGFSIGHGFVMLDLPKNDWSKISEKLDLKIDENKIEQGTGRAIGAIYEVKSKKKPSDLHDDKSKEAVSSTLEKYEKELNIDPNNPSKSPNKWPEKLIPVEDMLNAEPWRNPELIRIEAAKHIAQDFSGVQRELLLSAVKTYDSRDNVTELKTDRDLVADLNRQAKHSGERNVILVDIESLNLSGKNKVLGSDAADKLLKEEYDIIIKTLKEELGEAAKNLENNAYSSSGGKAKLRLIVGGVEHEDLQKALTKAQKNVEREIGERGIHAPLYPEYTQIKAIRHLKENSPKGKDMPPDFWNKKSGAGFAYTAIKMNKELSASKALNIGEFVSTQKLDKGKTNQETKDLLVKSNSSFKAVDFSVGLKGESPKIFKGYKIPLKEGGTESKRKRPRDPEEEKRDISPETIKNDKGGRER